ncbi:MAG TPA: cyclase family protein [Dehalococcoidia bacterium]|nr:cyclase family protein [Dehalococcoidia bacterium]
MAIDLEKLPRFADLPVQEGLGLRSSWGLFGPHDELGTWNLVTPRKTAEAASMVKKGAVFSLNAPIDEMTRPLFWFRAAPRVTMFDCSFGMRISYDEYIDNFCPQSSSQWDGHRHVCHPAAGFYNGVKHEEVLAPGSMTLGIQNLAKRGVATRGVLLDIGRFLEQEGTPLEMHSSQTIDAATLEACRERQGVEIRPGDVLIFRLGWLQWFREQPAQTQTQLAEHLLAPGLLAGEEMAAYLWDLHIAAIATDVIAVEAWPPVITPGRGFFHIQLITGFGMNLGELWDLEALAEDCAADGVYEFMLTSAPLHIRGGVGSPPNALAIK